MRVVIVRPKEEPVISKINTFRGILDLIDGSPIISDIKLRDNIRIFMSEEADYKEKDFNRAVYRQEENKILPKYAGTLYGTVIIANSSMELFPESLSEKDAEEMKELFKGEKVVIDFKKK